jgi:hypothetical protein
MALLSPLAFGFVLDIASSGVHGQCFAFAALGLVSMSGPLMVTVFPDEGLNNHCVFIFFSFYMR